MCSGEATSNNQSRKEMLAKIVHGNSENIENLENVCISFFAG